MAEKTASKPGSEQHDLSKEVVAEVHDSADQKLDVEHAEEVSESYRAIEKSLVRKLDFTLVPMLWLLYLFNYLDRNNIA